MKEATILSKLDHPNILKVNLLINKKINFFNR